MSHQQQLWPLARLPIMRQNTPMPLCLMCSALHDSAAAGMCSHSLHAACTWRFVVTERRRVCAPLQARNGFTVVRMFAFPVQEGFNLQTAAGIFNERAFKGLDIAVAEAAKNNLRLVLAFMNNWNYNPKQTDWKCAAAAPRCYLVICTMHAPACTASWLFQGRKVHHPLEPEASSDGHVLSGKHHFRGTLVCAGVCPDGMLRGAGAGSRTGRPQRWAATTSTRTPTRLQSTRTT